MEGDFPVDKLLLKEGSISFRTSRPVIGISHQVRQGYQLIEIDLQLRTIQITDQLTMEALMTQLFLAGIHTISLK